MDISNKNTSAVEDSLTDINIARIKLTTEEKMKKKNKRKNSKSEKVLEARPTASRRLAGSNWSNVLAQNSLSEKKTATNGGCTKPVVEDINKKQPSKANDMLNETGNPSNENSSAFQNSRTDINSITDVKITNNSLPKNRNPESVSKAARNRQRRKLAAKNKILAMDCEMVGTGPSGTDDMLARVSIVNQQGDVLLDKYVQPREPVTDYRTEISGIRSEDIEKGEDFVIVQDEVVRLLQGKILIGHGIRSDLAVLYIKHPFANIRDTARYKPLSRLVSNGHTPSLKRLSKAILGIDIQTGEHNSVEDARAAMNIYNRLSEDWEKYVHRNKIAKFKNNHR